MATFPKSKARKAKVVVHDAYTFTICIYPYCPPDWKGLRV